MKPTKDQLRYLRQENRKYGDALVFIHPSDWPASFKSHPFKPSAVWRSRHFLVQVFDDPLGLRVSVNRADVDRHGNWKDGITWDELQAIKESLFPGRVAVEMYPAQINVVNVANIRHLWIMPPDLAARLPIWKDDADTPLDTSNRVEDTQSCPTLPESKNEKIAKASQLAA